MLLPVTDAETWTVSDTKLLNWLDEDSLLFRILFPLLKEAALAGAESALLGLLEIGIGVDWGLVNESATRWARQYVGALVQQVNGTTRRFLQSEIARWIESGAPLDDLMESLTPMFGKVRAQMIAVTEVTRSFAEGNITAWQESGVVDSIRWMTARDELVCPICQPLHGREGPLDSGIDGVKPPAHVNCRCWIQPVVSG